MRRISIAPRIGAASTEMLNSRNHAWGFAWRTWKNLEHIEEAFEEHRKKPAHRSGRAGPLMIGRPALACHRLAGKQLILLDEARAGVVTQSMARPTQVREGQLTYGALRRLHDEYDRSSLVHREHFGDRHEWYPPCQ